MFFGPVGPLISEARELGLSGVVDLAKQKADEFVAPRRCRCGGATKETSGYVRRVGFAHRQGLTSVGEAHDDAKSKPTQYTLRFFAMRFDGLPSHEFPPPTFRLRRMTARYCSVIDSRRRRLSLSDFGCPLILPKLFHVVHSR